jgi:hypothetical protein
MTKYIEKIVKVKSDKKLDVIENMYDFKVLPCDKKLGVMIVGLGGNNGTTFTTSILSKQLNKSWKNKNGIHINLSEIQKPIIDELINFVNYINKQELMLSPDEKIKEDYKTNYF